MRRVFSLILCFFIFVFSAVPASAKLRRSLINTQAEQMDQPAPSFRGGDQRPVQQIPSQGGVQPGVGVPMTIPGQEGQMSLTGMVGYQVHVLGEVSQPGTYTINASGRLADAIRKAGGFADNGSDRRVQLKRNGRVVQTVDFLNYQLMGNLADNPYLQDNDVVFVPLRKNVIRVVGAVRRPETYELRNEKTLAQVIKLAGGFNAATARGEPIRIIRFKQGKKDVEEITNNSHNLKKISVLNGDVIVVPNVVTKETEFDYNVASIPGDQVFYPSYEDRVFVLGGVEQPGAYPFSPYYTVNQYISLAGGITEKGKEKYKVITPSGKERNANENERVNPGDTIKIKERWMTPAGWLGFGLSIASFGLSASATVLAITR